MVNRRIRRLPIGEGKYLVGHLEQSAGDRIVNRIRELRQVSRQVRKVGSDIRPSLRNPTLKVADSGVWGMRDVTALIWINWGTRGSPGRTATAASLDSLTAAS
jgi:hypothetical protein